MHANQQYEFMRVLIIFTPATELIDYEALALTEVLDQKILSYKYGSNKCHLGIH